jgi:hypothetical protein
MSKPYTCALCAAQPSRCAACRARRAEADRARRELKRSAGVCICCTRPALPGLSRCEVHRADNALRSGDAHAAARAELRDAALVD